MPNATTFGRPVRERLVPNPKARLREQFRVVAHFKFLSYRTEEAYWDWVVRSSEQIGGWQFGDGENQSRLTPAATIIKGSAWRTKF
ncbi:MAG TPA: hypothetical protein VG077_05255 [Verrucomicrobiae bacterium]|nr:hypothetical protein [Verrucomicrobiae bacterium]